ncbi:MAG: efflux RND transporter periplasmic adaptor subunit, partial [Pseudomonadota bacterium]
MSKSFHSSYWYRVKDKRPRLRSHARFFRTEYRGQTWYVLQDRSSGRFHRFTGASYFIASMLDGQRTLDEIWQTACSALNEEDALTQDEILQLLSQLHTADVLHSDEAPDIEEMVKRGRKQRFKKRMMSVLNPLALRIPMLDPEGFLKITMPLVRPLFSIYGLVAYLALLAYGSTLAVLNWDGLTENVLDRVLSTESLMLLLVTYPVVKAIHELGHAYAITRWGGEVHEIGIMFLVFMPVPYVDASDSLSFPSKWKRAFVASAGILVELGLAAAAMVVWVNAEPGLVRAFAFNTMLIGGLSTLFFNGNPLLRFDWYFVLSDLLEIPNLGNRSNRYIGYLVQKHMLGIKEAENPAHAPGEPFWFVTYSVLAFLYRIFITIAIVLLVSSKFFSLGIILAIWSLVLIFGVPIAKQIWFLLASPKLRGRRARAMGVVLGSLGAIVGALLFVPLPYSTIAEGVVWVPEDGAVHANGDGVVVEVLVAQGEQVVAGQPLVQMADPLLAARVALLEATVAETTLRRDSLAVSDPAAARIAASELEHAMADLELARERETNLTVRATTAGSIALTETTDLPGRYLTRGQLLGYVSAFKDPVIRAVVSEGDADFVKQRTKDIDIRFISAPAEAHPARIIREVPALEASLPSLALATQGGGRIVLDPNDSTRSRTLQNLLHLDLRLDAAHEFATIGERTSVRFL